MTNSINDNSLDSLYHLLDFLEEPLRVSHNEELRANRYFSPSFSALAYFDNNETKQTEIIGSLLDPNGKHGQGTLFLRHFLTKAWPDIKFDKRLEDDLQKVKIYREHYINCDDSSGKPCRRIDLWIEIGEMGSSRVLAIESKAKDAIDQGGQIKAYLQHMKKSCRGFYKLLYLSPNGREPLPLEDSIDRQSWETACNAGFAEAQPYSEFIHDWLQGCKSNCSSRRVTYFIEDLLTFVNPENERTTVTPKFNSAVGSLLKEQPANKSIEARRNTLLSIWELSDLMTDEILKSFQSNLLDYLSIKHMACTLVDGDGQPNELGLLKEDWGMIRLPGLEYLGKHQKLAIYAAIQQCPPGFHKQEKSHLIIGLNVQGQEERTWLRTQALASKLGKGTGDPNWIWQEIPIDFKDLHSKDTALSLLDPQAAVKLIVQIQDRLKLFEELIRRDVN